MFLQPLMHLNGSPSVAHGDQALGSVFSDTVIPHRYAISRKKQHEVGRNFGARAAVVEAVQIMERGDEAGVDRGNADGQRLRRRSHRRDEEVDSEQVGIRLGVGRRGSE